MVVAHHRVVIVGTGFSGLGMAVRLAQRGDGDFVLLERADDVGGTWRDNRYPGCACDVPSRLYSFSFDQKPDWSRDYATAPEIWAYLRDVADRHRLRAKIAFGADLEQAEYDAAQQRWLLTTSDSRQWTADALVLGVGALHEPSCPDFPGLSDFTGEVIHTTRWPEHDGLDGRRVAVVGTGASAVQVVPELAHRTGHLTVFQRTPAWTLPKRDLPWTPRRQRAFRRYPALQRAVRWLTYWRMEAQAPLFVRFPVMATVVEAIARRELAKSVRDPQVRAKLTPDYTLGCKRVLLSSSYWPTFDRDDVDLVTEAIARVERDAVVTDDGVRHEVDAIVLATGFSLTGSYDRMVIRGLRGRTLDDAWSQGAHTHLGITVAGFPELYLLFGPNTALGHSSAVMMTEFATRYILQGLDRARSGARVTTAAAQAAFTDEMRRRFRGTVWATGCRSWYLDRFGHNTALWPGSTVAYWWRTRTMDDSVFERIDVSSSAVPQPAEDAADA